MTDGEKIFLGLIEDYCNVKFDEENLPAGVKLAIAELSDYNPSSARVSSEKLSDMSISYAVSEKALPLSVINYLAPYRKPYLVGNKARKEYKGG